MKYCLSKKKPTSKKPFILDTVRKKYVSLTPEEQVRNKFLAYLLKVLKYPKGLIRVERALKKGGTPQRADIVVYHRNGTPFLLIECKATTVTLQTEVINQAFAYNCSLQAPYIVVTNGKGYLCFKFNLQEKKYDIIAHIPSYADLCNYVPLPS